MTLDAVLTRGRLKERHALARVRLAIARGATDGDWVYVLAALDARLAELDALLSREDPQVVKTSSQMLDDERRTAGYLNIQEASLPRAARVH